EALGEAIDRRFGRLDILVHAAGITRDAVLWKMEPEAWDAVLRVNLSSAFHLLRLAVPRMRKGGGGSIVFISSINGERGKFGQANYAASKAGLIGLARTAAREGGRFSIRVNVVAPGMILTPLTENLPREILDRAVEETALGRLGRPADVAAATLFLASDLGRHVTGQVLRVDGGQLMA
ncbi:MAG: SDR family oxidoreductase, partial [Planctomycetota bacterium]